MKRASLEEGDRGAAMRERRRNRKNDEDETAREKEMQETLDSALTFAIDFDFDAFASNPSCFLIFLSFLSVDT